jgi:Glycosyl hydrolase family 76
MIPRIPLSQPARHPKYGGYLSRLQVVTAVLCLLFCALVNASFLPSDVSRPSLAPKDQHSFSDHERPNAERGPTLQYPLGQDGHAIIHDVKYSHPQHPFPNRPSGAEEVETLMPLNHLSALMSALDVMQKHFAVWQGCWTESIDWTAAVLGTYVASALSTISASLDFVVPPQTNRGEAQLQENIINGYFTQLTSFYFGQNSVALRMEAYDDMLWVVLGWLEAIKFISLHSSLHYSKSSSAEPPGSSSYNSTTWYGNQFIPAYAHRARVFYELASQGWDTSLCGGGMIWNPRLLPYKNAITNELFLTASISMYLYFPGDDNTSPFAPLQTEGEIPPASTANIPPAKPYDPKYLVSALEAYKWLSASNMTNEQGLYVDGFHISNFGSGNGTNSNTRCDERNEMVYTYNQGVLLSGLRGLWESTGAQSYLDEGYKLIESVINATGWTWGAPVNNRRKDRWSGLGSRGILEEACDYWGSCSQDGQTFKGIFFHHLTLYCVPLPSEPERLGVTFSADAELAQLHEDNCNSYADWIAHNARAAYSTRNADGEFGMWWGSPAGNSTLIPHAKPDKPDGAVDYRNLGVPTDSTWGGRKEPREQYGHAASRSGDLNDRGRGRTVETQGGGISVLRAMWEIVDLRGPVAKYQR